MIVIATLPRRQHFPVTAEHRNRFLELLPRIRRQAQSASRRLRAEAQQEFVQAVIAAAYVAFVRLIELDKEDIVYSTPLAHYAILHVRSGRTIGSRLNVQDISSRYGHSARRCLIQRLDRRYADGRWREVLVEDYRTGPAETAAARIDVSDWFRSLPARTQRIAFALAFGDATRDVAATYGLSASRVSQLRNELRTSWLGFQGELPPVCARRTRSVPAHRVTSNVCAGQITT